MKTLLKKKIYYIFYIIATRIVHHIAKFLIPVIILREVLLDIDWKYEKSYKLKQLKRAEANVKKFKQKLKEKNGKESKQV